MKKIFVAVSVLISLLGFSQNTGTALQFGVKGGGNLSSLMPSDKDRLFELSSKLGYYSGFFLNYKFNKSMALQPELLYNLKGEAYKDFETGIEGNFDRAYISLPLMFQYIINQNIYGEIGPEFSYLISAKQTTNNNEYEPVDIKRVYNTFDIGLGFGAGYKFSPGFSVGLRYTFGITPVYKEQADYEVYKATNGNFQMGINYYF